MSRSYKHIACYTDHNSGTWQRKRWASKAIRRSIFDITNGNMYKKVYETWSICDYKFLLEYDPKYRNLEILIKARRK
jgi:hypothetical protein